MEETVPESEVKKEEPKKEEGKGSGSYIFRNHRSCSSWSRILL